MIRLRVAVQSRTNKSHQPKSITFNKTNDENVCTIVTAEKWPMRMTKHGKATERKKCVKMRPKTKSDKTNVETHE